MNSNFTLHFRASFLFILLFAFFGATAQNVVPTLENINMEFDDSSATFTIQYQITDPDNDNFKIDLLLSEDNGTTYGGTWQELTGDVGENISLSGEKTITAVYASSDISSLQIRIVVSDYEEFDIQSIVDAVDSTEIKNRLTFIQGARNRFVDIEHLEETQTYIFDYLNNLGLDTFMHTFQNGTYEAINIFALQEGITNPQKEYYLGGHYDSVVGSAGADDNGSAVAGFMEAARILAPYNFNKSIRYVSWDLEELGLVGSNDFVNNSLQNKENVQGYLNLEMIGYYTDKPNTQTFPTGFDQLFPDLYNEVAEDDFRGNFLINIGNEATSFDLMNDFKTASNTYVPELIVRNIASPGAGQFVPDLLRSDHAAFWSKEIPALMLTDGSEFRNPNYHSATDVMDSLDFNFMTNIVKASVAYLAEKAEIQHSNYYDISSLVGVIDTDITTEYFLISPNPASTEIHIVFSRDLNIKAIDYKLIDLNGKELGSGTISKTNQHSIVDITSLPSGIYNIVFQSEKILETLQFVKK